jgi:hypothetical protein
MTQIQIVLRPVLMQWTISRAWMTIDAMIKVMPIL